MMANDEKNEQWIREFLVPKLVSDGKLSLPPTADDKSSETTVEKVEIRKLSLKEAFMLNICYKINITLTNGTLTNDYAIVAKITPEMDELTFKMCDFNTLFKNEVMAYEEILPLIGISKNCPTYYYSHINELEAAIALSDFNVDGWKMSPSLVNLSLEHILTSVEQLGKFHGAAYALKETNQTLFQSIINKFQESRFRFDSAMEQWDRHLRIGPKRSVLAVRTSTELKSKIPDEFLNKLTTQFEDVYNYQKSKVKPIEPFAVICHGDFLRNNIAYKYDGGDKPIAAMMFDFQTLRYASPMIDLTTFMANSTGFEVRRKHFDDIFHKYHSALVEQYKKIVDNKKVPEFLSYDSLLTEYVRYLPFGFSIAASFIAILHVPIEGEFNMDIDIEEDIKDCMERGGETVDRELRALVEDIYDFNLRYNVELA